MTDEVNPKAYPLAEQVTFRKRPGDISPTNICNPNLKENKSILHKFGLNILSGKISPGLLY